MTAIVFTDIAGQVIEVEVEDGSSVMQAAVDNGIDGVSADCGGNCSCATCHVYVDDAFMDIVGGPGDLEGEMLDFKDNRRETSRLSCQIKVTPELAGMHVTVAD